MDLSPFNPILSRKQSEAWRAIHRPDIEEMLYGGAKGGAKSVFLCYWMYLDCYELARQYVPQPRDYPIPVGWLGRKVAKHFKETTLDTWKRFIPAHYYELKGDPPSIIIANRVLIRTGGLDTSEAIQKFNSAEFARVGVDQAEETTRDDVGVLRATRRLVVGGRQIPAKIIYTANPAQCWLKEDFINSCKPGRVFIPALYKDNPWLPADYMRILEESFAYRPDLLRAYRDGIWEGLSGIDQIVLEEWVTAAKMRMGHQGYVKRLVSIDPAYFGDDRCVVLGLENTRVVDVKVLPQSGSRDIAHEGHAMSLRMGGCPVVVEEVGADDVSGRLIELGTHVIKYHPAEASAYPDKYYNKRAEVWSSAAKWFQSGVWDSSRGQMVSLPEPDDSVDSGAGESPLHQAWREVCKEITWPKYKFRGQKILVQPKDEIKAEHEGRSPDYGDAYVNGLFYLPRVPVVEVQERGKQVRTNQRRERARIMSV